VHLGELSPLRRPKSGAPLHRLPPLGPVPRLTAPPLAGMAAGGTARAVGIPSPVLTHGQKSQAGLGRPNTARGEQLKLSFSQGIYFKSSL
jgi:hypothetical protein